jgi:adenylate kinase
MDKGELVSDAVVIGMIEGKIDANLKCNGFIFDGFPRTKAQAKALDDMLKKKGIAITRMLALEVEKEELIKRLLLRGKESGRADDQDTSIIENRIKVYNKETTPVKDFYKAQNKYTGIQGFGSIDDIFNMLCLAIDQGN